MNMIFGVKDRPKFGQTILFAIQQLLAARLPSSAAWLQPSQAAFP